MFSEQDRIPKKDAYDIRPKTPEKHQNGEKRVWNVLGRKKMNMMFNKV